MQTEKIEELLKKPYWIIDILPKQVPKDSPGQYFAIEDFFLKEQIGEIKGKHINAILKLNCYMDIFIDDEKNPSPERIRDILLDRHACILMGDAMILSEADDAIEYQNSEPQGNINKELYMEHDENIMKMICDFYDNSR